MSEAEIVELALRRVSDQLGHTNITAGHMLAVAADQIAHLLSERKRTEEMHV